VYVAFRVGVASRYISVGAALLALLGLAWRGVGWQAKASLLAVAVLSWFAAVFAGDVLASCFGRMAL
jgi:hypothetical protein